MKTHDRTADSQPTRLPVVTEVVRLHQIVDEESSLIARLNAERLTCRRGCHDCCIDDISVFVVEAQRIRASYSELLESGSPHPPGACAFLDGDGACRIYDDRPYVCRTQGLPLRWLADGPDGTTVEYRDICPLNEEGEPLESLDETHCWQLGPHEARLAQLQAAQGEGLVRVKLRDLFRGDS